MSNPCKMTFSICGELLVQLVHLEEIKLAQQLALFTQLKKNLIRQIIKEFDQLHDTNEHSTGGRRQGSLLV